ncbi:2-hydroxyacid dehydrogenase [Dehalobacter sp. DCM]|uniref:2-hydroxyacid dehydrogenase n=1 Tax=Dehalobacter sp. DCM TaxID=2907827 RepID=UPI0030813D49|nr:2-hydroxyacid dehydrogenase [Dehalobacter sp. DCM]
MKIAILTSKARVDHYMHKSMIPADWEMIDIGQHYTDDEVIEKASDAECILVDAILPVSRKIIEALPALKMIHSEGVGYNRIDIEAARERNVYVCNNFSVNAGAVAEQTVLLMLTTLRRFSEGEMMIRKGKQIEAKGQFCLEGIPELEFCHVGIIGFGAIGRETAKRLKGFGCRVSYNNTKPVDIKTEEQLNVTYLDLEAIYKQCDIISIHVPVTPKTINMFNRDVFSKMKKTAILINTARGEIINHDDLKEAIVSGQIAGAGLDTLAPEPVLLDNPILNLPEEYQYRVSLSPHIAGLTKNVFETIYKNIATNMRRVQDGKRPVCIVNSL